MFVVFPLMYFSVVWQTVVFVHDPLTVRVIRSVGTKAISNSRPEGQFKIFSVRWRGSIQPCLNRLVCSFCRSRMIAGLCSTVRLGAVESRSTELPAQSTSEVDQMNKYNVEHCLVRRAHRTETAVRTVWYRSMYCCTPNTYMYTHRTHV